jgi:beta-glucosidase
MGPLVKPVRQNQGFWSVELPGDSSFIVSQWQGMKNKIGPQTQLLYAKGCDIEGTSKDGFAEAIETAKQADVVILSMGEKRDMSGEAKSRSNIQLPGVQEDFIRAIQETGKPVVVLINAGRPLIFNWTADHVPAILYTWWLGSEAGNSIADVLFGDYNPAGKLPMTFPRAEGQIPIYYDHFNTGRPALNDRNHIYNSSYNDLSIYPKFAFGYGLSYTTFQYSNLKLSTKKMTANQNIEVSVDITNTGKYQGEEVVQLYLRDKFASSVRPVKELKDFQKIKLNIGETKTIRFIIDRQKLSFYNQKFQWVTEDGDFDLMIGSSSEDIRLIDTFELIH